MRATGALLAFRAPRGVGAKMVITADGVTELGDDELASVVASVMENRP